MNRQEKGLATTSVVVYIIALLFVISVLSAISTYFSKQIQITLAKNESARAYITFMSYFTQDIQEEGNSVEIIDTETQEENGEVFEINYIAFSNGNKYVFYEKNSSIYKNDIKICESIDYCKFYKTEYGENKTLIQVDFIDENFNRIGENALEFYM